MVLTVVYFLIVLKAEAYIHNGMHVRMCPDLNMLFHPALSRGYRATEHADV